MINFKREEFEGISYISKDSKASNFKIPQKFGKI